jgi:hypothetical protein
LFCSAPRHARHVIIEATSRFIRIAPISAALLSSDEWGAARLPLVEKSAFRTRRENDADF